MAEFNPCLVPTDSSLEITLGNQTKQRVRNAESTPAHSLSNVDQAIKYSHIFPQLDIIASSRHVKSLFKIPFSKDPFSFAVHRIGKTLIFDDFFLNLRSSPSASTQPEPRAEPKSDNEKKERIHCTHYSSLPELTAENPDMLERVVSRNVVPFPSQLIPFEQSLVPVQESKRERKQVERRHSEGASDPPHSNSKMNNPSLILSSTPQPLTLTTSGDINLSYGPSLRDILWRFEDYSMLLGCDMPIFGMGTYPAVSLFLQDARMPINVLTGIDIWLDNLMNNVPEVLMAYHVENVIRNYEVVNNDSIPTLPNSKFSPDLISNICANILHFLKANCTKEGHTYWLLREKGEDIIKLYDLTSLVQHKEEPHIPQQFDNPFVDPVALLFYKVATQMYRNLSHDIDTYPEELGTIKHMLEQVIRLLAQAGRPSKLGLTAYQLLTDIFLGLESISEILSPNVHSETAVKENKHRKKKSKKSAKIQASKPPIQQDRNYLAPLTSGANKPVSWPVANMLASHEEYAAINRNIPTPIKLGSNEERARIAMDYIAASLELAAHFRSEGEFVLTYVNEMLTKAAGCFYIIGQSSFTLDRLGRSLRFAIHGLRTLFPVCNTQSSELVLLLKFTILELTGDILCQLAKSKEISTHQKDFIETDPEFEPILSHAPDRVGFDSFIPPIELSANRVDTLLSSIDCYLYLESEIKKSTQFQFKNASLLKRLGNAYNEIGLMSIDSIINQEHLITETKLQLAKSAFAYFQNAIRYFKISADVLNLVLVHSNCGRLMRICAFHLTSKELTVGKHQTPQWRHYCEEAIAAYQSGIKLLSNDEYPDLCNNLKFDVSNVKIQIVTSLMATERDETEIHEILQHLKSSISILEELVAVQFGRRTEAVFNLSLAYFYFGKIERQHFEECLRNKAERAKNYYHLSEKYFLKSNEILDNMPQLESRSFIQKCKNYTQLHDLTMLNSFNSKLQAKHKQISTAILHLSNLFYLFTKLFPNSIPINELTELSEFGEQSLLKLRFLTSLLFKQTGTYTGICKEVMQLEEIVGKLKFSVLESKIDFDSSILAQLLTTCSKIVLELS